MEEAWAMGFMQEQGGVTANRKGRTKKQNPRGQGKKTYERNDRVTITNGKETQEMKYKRAESLIQNGEWKIVDVQ